MIVCRKPWTLYDVDLLGIVAVLALSALGTWLFLSPWQRTWDEYRRLLAARREAEARLQADVLRFERFQGEFAPLESMVANEAQAMPTADAYSRLLRQMTDLARGCSLDLREVVPQPIAASGAYLISDIQVGGRGRSPDFIRFLDQLAQANPFQVLRTCTISRPPASTQPACELAWTVRLYLLPPTPPPTPTTPTPPATGGGA